MQKTKYFVKYTDYFLQYLYCQHGNLDMHKILESIWQYTHFIH